MNLPPVIRAAAIYTVAASLLAAIGSIVTTYVLHWYDAKFDDNLAAALEAQLLGLGIFLIGASIVFSLAYQFLPGEGGGGAWRIALSGAIYPIGVLLLGPILAGVDPESWINPTVGGLYLIAYSVLAAFWVRS